MSDIDIKTLSKTELGSESSVCWRVLRTPFTVGPPFCSSSLKFAIHPVSSDLNFQRLVYRISITRSVATAEASNSVPFLFLSSLLNAFFISYLYYYYFFFLQKIESRIKIGNRNILN